MVSLLNLSGMYLKLLLGLAEKAISHISLVFKVSGIYFKVVDGWVLKARRHNSKLRYSLEISDKWFEHRSLLKLLHNLF